MLQLMNEFETMGGKFTPYLHLPQHTANLMGRSFVFESTANPVRGGAVTDPAPL